MKRQIGFLFFSRAIAGLCQVLILIVLARSLSASDLGPIMVFLGIANFLVAICDLGVGTLLIRVRAERPDSRMIPRILRINTFGMIAAGLVLLVIGFTFYQAHLNPFFVVLSTLWVVLERNSETWVAMCVADRRNGLASVVTLIRRVLPLALILPLGVVVGGPGVAFAVSQVVGGIAGLVFVRAGLRQSIPAIGPSGGYIRVVRAAMPYWLAVGSSQAREIEGVFVSLFGGPIAAGAYSLAQRLSKPLQLFATSLSQVVLARAGGTSADYRRMSNGLAMATTLLIFLGLVSIPAISWLGPFFLGDEHQSAIPVLQVAVVAMAFIAMASPFSSLLQAGGQASFVAAASLVTAVAGLAGAALGASVWGALGACAGTSLVYAVKFLALLFRTRSL